MSKISLAEMSVPNVFVFFGNCYGYDKLIIGLCAVQFCL